MKPVVKTLALIWFLLLAQAWAAGTQHVIVDSLSVGTSAPNSVDINGVGKAATVTATVFNESATTGRQGRAMDVIPHNTVVCNTSYIVSATTSPTGLGAWIDCTGAKKVIFQYKLSADTDNATPKDTGTYYVDASIQLNTFLSTVSVWNCTIGNGAQYQTLNSTIITVSDPPRSLRWRISGATRNTNSVSYQLVF